MINKKRVSVSNEWCNTAQENKNNNNNIKSAIKVIMTALTFQF